eukprot:1029518-Rhodomonas_salina.1
MEEEEGSGRREEGEKRRFKREVRPSAVRKGASMVGRVWRSHLAPITPSLPVYPVHITVFSPTYNKGFPIPPMCSAKPGRVLSVDYTFCSGMPDTNALYQTQRQRDTRFCSSVCRSGHVHKASRHYGKGRALMVSAYAAH